MKKIIIMVVILVIIGTTIFRLRGKEQELKTEINPHTLNSNDVAQVKFGTIDQVITFTGDLAPLHQTIISAQINAQVKQVLVNEGQYVAKGQLLAKLDTLEVEQTVLEQQAQLDSIKAQSNLEQQKMIRQKELYHQGFISQIAYNELLTNYQASLEKIKAQQAILTAAKKQLMNAQIQAPFAGVIYQKSIDLGQIVSKNAQLFALANLDFLQIKAAIGVDKINSIKPGQIVKFKVDNSNKVYKGIIARINPIAQNETRSYNVYINFNNKQNQLKAGQFVKGEIVLQQLNNVLIIPSDTLRTNNKGENYVLVATKGQVQVNKVTVLLQNSIINVSAVSGVKLGNKVIMNSVLNIKPGDKISLINN